MANSARVIRVDGLVTDLDHRPTLTEAQGIVEGYLELVKVKDAMTGHTVTLVVNEDGKPTGLPVNWVATNEYGAFVSGGVLVGNVIVLTGWQTVGN